MRTLVTLFAVWLAALAASAESLSCAKLKPDEIITIFYRSTGCFHSIDRLYQIQGGTPLRFSVLEDGTYRQGIWSYDDKNRIVKIANLTDNESFGLDCYFLFLRQRYKGNCTTTDDIAIGYYRNGKKIGEEKFHDSTCQIASFHWDEHGRIIVPYNQPPPADFPWDVYKAIIPPWLIEKRIKI